jgi:hypothetical protein
MDKVKSLIDVDTAALKTAKMYQYANAKKAIILRRFKSEKR